MKQIKYYIILVLTLGLAFSSCSNDDNIYSPQRATNAEKASAGTYTGTWTVTQKTNITTSPGSVTLVATDSTGCTNITFLCSQMSLNAKSIANVWNSSEGFQFVNQIATSPLNAAFSGRITQDGSLTTNFSITTKDSKGKNVTYNYSFTGQNSTIKK
ncbi:MAG: hypothetical protein LKK21_05570 [Prevotella sp.]|jgi:hypothetical protein|nr:MULTISPECIES: hypothetical protein [unclassified Prevotella]MCH3985301.1 hypothetical protein [Prevotella sp.]MCH4017099.1 hypothetical protein [Prevotella sp.]MCH4186471.1 hypothetical protein [Prevotella sp.]MCH4250710.1 hypothetical protein [Prevotella sp.]MCI1324763.1 hypothetical protein [Prevotella sp.]